MNRFLHLGPYSMRVKPKIRSCIAHARASRPYFYFSTIPIFLYISILLASALVGLKSANVLVNTAS